jgi:hypothetical protein
MLDDLITVHGACENAEMDHLYFSGVTFVRDFGPWKAGQDVDNIAFDFERGTVRQFDDGGKVVAQCRFTLQAT